MGSLKVGDRVRFTDWVDRFPFFEVPPETTGTVVDIGPGGDFGVLLDRPLEGCAGEEWENVVHFWEAETDQRENLRRIGGAV
jgi:hypothetical protein